MIKKYTIYLTKQCNCRCLYCYQQDFNKKYLWKEIKKQLNNVIKDKDHKYKIIEFIGGEPFLVFNLLKKAYKYLESKTYIMAYYISTNGTILNNDIIDFIKKHNNVYLFISLDGNKKMNKLRLDINKKEIFNIVVNNIKTLINNNLQKKLVIHMVLHNYNVNNLFNGIIFLQKIGIKNVDIGIVEGTQKLNKEFCLIFINQHLKLSKAIKNKEININIFTLIYKPNIKIENNFSKLNQYLRKIVYKNHLLIVKGENNYENRIKR